MRCLFTMFAEDVGLMKKGSFVRLLEDYRETPDKLHLALTDLWRCMNTGGFSPMLRTDLLRFNGGLFKDASAIEVTGDDLALLLLAAEHEWQNVEPAIFGTLLERALDPPARHRLGAPPPPPPSLAPPVVAPALPPPTP